MKRTTSILLVVVGLALVAFIPGLGGPFLHDDHPNLARLVVGPFSLDAALDVAIRNDSGLLKRSVSNLSLAANYWVHGMDAPFGFKLVNWLIHALTAVLLILLVRELLRAFRVEPDPTAQWAIALAAGFLWAAHPVQVSTVLYVVQRMAQLSTLFTLLGVMLVTRFLNEGTFTWRRTVLTAAGFLVATLLAVGSKENGVLAPVMAAVVIGIWWARHPEPKALSEIRPLRTFILFAIVLPILAGASIAATHPELLLGSYGHREFTVAQRLLTEPVVLLFYLRLFLVPYTPWMGIYHDDFPIYGAADAVAWLAVATWLGLVVTALLVVRRWPLFSFAVLWFVAGHLLESTVIGLELVYEHRNYLPIIGPMVLAAAAIVRFTQRVPHLRRITWVAIGGILMVATFSRSVDWSSERHFYSAESRHHPDSFRALIGEFYRLQNAGATDAAFAEMRNRVRESRPDLVWPMLMDAAIQCSNAGHEVDWRGIEQRIKNFDGLYRLPEYYQFLVDRMIGGTCEHIDFTRLVHSMEVAYQVAMAQQYLSTAARYAKLIAWSHRATDDMVTAERWHLIGATTDPRNHESLFDLAFLYLNTERADRAAEIADELERRAEKYGLAIGYRIDEVRDFVAVLERERPN